MLCYVCYISNMHLPTISASSISRHRTSLFGYEKLMDAIASSSPASVPPRPVNLQNCALHRFASFASLSSSSYSVGHIIMPGVCPVYARCMPGVCPVYARCMPGICPVYARCMPGVCPVYARASPLSRANRPNFEFSTFYP
jgi:hypothetical protein